MESLMAIVKGTDCDLGIAFDGDCDRMLAVDENGELVDGDQIMAICAKQMLSEGKFKNEVIKILPQVIVNAKVPNDRKNTLLEDAEIKALIDEFNKKMEGKGRVLIRPSVTEPLVRVMLEGDNKAELEKRCNKSCKVY